MAEDLSVQYYDTSNLEGVSISSTSYRNHYFPRHFHDHYTIQLIEEGVNEGFTESDSYKIGDGGLLLINPGELHAGNSLDNQTLKFHTIRIEEKLIRAICERNEIFQHTDLRFNTRPIYRQESSARMRTLIADITAGRVMDIEASFEELFMILIQNHSNTKVPTRPTAHTHLDLARQFICDHFREELTLGQIAENCHLSPYHFSRQFKKKYGLTPFQYLRNVRIEKAKALLTKHSISQTALQTGFFDHSHFLRNFKRIEGVVPSCFLKAN
ncbi:MAG: AraC family transcriptional regulator [Reichenbachiella sp.]|uniref:helix-turn-helix transcriptional regulator n=1 Tax=Reichenbachiella sp. TaxID=2184521 RepID=UPI0032640FA1